MEAESSSIDSAAAPPDGQVSTPTHPAADLSLSSLARGAIDSRGRVLGSLRRRLAAQEGEVERIACWLRLDCWTVEEREFVAAAWRRAVDRRDSLIHRVNVVNSRVLARAS